MLLVQGRGTTYKFLLEMARTTTTTAGRGDPDPISERPPFDLQAVQAGVIPYYYWHCPSRAHSRHLTRMSRYGIIT
jgi:hypothetical protein